MSPEYGSIRKWRPAPPWFDRFVNAYFEAALWTSTDEDMEPLDKNYSINDIAPEAKRQMGGDCLRFVEANWVMIEDDPVRAGHDFWLTRNRHGAGFWDGGWGEIEGEILTKEAHGFGEQHLYVGDDGLIYSM